MNLNKTQNKEKYINIGVYIFLFLLAFIFLMSSPLNPFKPWELWVDSAVFKHIGYLMTKGYIPYRDLFDHKGPLIYFYNYIGTFISYYHGVWYIELLSLFATFIALYKSSRLYLNKVYSMLLVIITSTILFQCLEEGNLVEEYALPFISIALYIFLEYFKKKDITKFKLILNGFCFGGVCMLRPNMVSLWIAFCILVLVQKIKEKRLIDILYFILYFLIGAALMILPFCIWLIKAGAWNYFIADYIKFNALYSGHTTNTIRIITTIHFAFEPVTFIALLYSIYMIFKYKEDRLFNIFNFIFIVISLALISMSGRVYLHYGIIMIPCVLYTYIIMMNNIPSNNKLLKYTILTFIICALVLPAWVKGAKNYEYIFGINKKDYIKPRTVQVVDYIKENTNEDDKICVYGTWSAVYVLTKREPGSRYMYTSPLTRIDKNVMKIYSDDVKRNTPKYFIIREEFMTKKVEKFLADHYYEPAFKSIKERKRAVFIYVRKGEAKIEK